MPLPRPRLGDGDSDGSVPRVERALSGFSFHRAKTEASSLSLLNPSDEFKGPLGLTLLHDPGDPLVDLVFVHGLGGGSRMSWCRSTDPYHYWPKEWLPFEPDFKRTRIHTFGYNADWHSTKGHLWDITHFGRLLLTSLHDSPALRRDRTQIILVGHSMGGIVIKKAYILARQDTDNYSALASRIHSLCFIGTPHRGADLAGTLTNILRLTVGQKGYVQDLERNSAMIGNVNDTFRHYAKDLQLCSFYETLSSNLKVMSAVVVDEGSATLGYANERIIPLNADHRGISKFADPSDPSYIIVRDALATTIDGITRELADPLLSGKAESTRNDRDRVETFLGGPELHEEDLLSHLDARLAGSCHWLPQRRDYLDWEAVSHSVPPVLWFFGRPAAGKSVLAASVIERLQAKSAATAYFFFNQGVATKRTVASCLRSLAYQMALQSDGVLARLLEMQEEKVTWDHNDERSIWRKVFLTAGIFQQIQDRPCYWILDGLDECLNPELFARLTPQLPPGLRVFVTSRNIQTIENAVISLPNSVSYQEMTTVDTQEDIRHLVEARMEVLPLQQPEQVTRQMMDKSGGSFMWVKLVLEELEQCYTDEAVQDALSQMPGDMNDLYLRMLGNIPSTPRAIKLARTVLTWTVCSSRPLTVDQLQCAIKLDISETAGNLERSVGQISGGLVFMDAFKRIQPVHLTALEFLVQQDRNIDFAIQKKEAHTHIATILLRYLSGDVLKPSPQPTTRRPSRPELAMNANLLGYAAQQFGYHLSASRSSDNALMNSLVHFFTTNVLAWIEYAAKATDLATINRTAAHVRDYLRRRERHVPPVDPKMQMVDGWVQDLIRIAAKFRSYLLASPSSIHCLIPPFCPADTRVFKQFANSGRSLVVHGQSAKEWDDCLTRIDFHSRQALSIAYGDSTFAVGLSDGTVKVYDDNTMQLKQTLQHGERVKLLAYGRQAGRLAASGNKKLSLWDAKTFDLVWSVPNEAQVIALSFDGQESLLAATSHNEILYWDITTAQTIQNGKLSWSESLLDLPPELMPNQPPQKALFSPDASSIAAAYRGKSILVINTDSGIVENRLVKTAADNSLSPVVRVGVDALAFNLNPDLPLLVVSYQDGELVVFDLNTYEESHTYREIYASSLACSPDGQNLVAGSARGTLQIFNFDGGGSLTLVYRIDAFEDGIRGLAFSGESSRFLDVRGSQCRVWGPPVLVRKDGIEGSSQSEQALPVSIKPRTINMLEGPADPEITVLLTSADGSYVFAGKEDGSIIAASMANITKHYQLRGFRSNVSATSLAITDDGKLLASADESGRIMVQRNWKFNDTQADSELIADKRFGQAVTGLHINGALDRLLITGRGRMELWTLPECERVGERDVPDAQSFEAMRHPKQQDLIILFEDERAHLFHWDDLAPASRPEGINLSRFGDPLPEGSFRSALYMGTQIITEMVTAPGPRPSRRLECWQAADFTPSTTNILPLTGFQPLGPTIKHIIALTSSVLLFVDTELWVCSLDLRTFPLTATAKRHFFTLAEWTSSNGRLLVGYTARREFVFARQHEIIAVRGGLDFAETLEFSNKTRNWKFSQGSMHRKTSHTLNR